MIGISFFLLGMLLSQNLSCRLKSLEKTLLLIKYCQMRIRYSRLPMKEIIIESAQNPEIGKLLYIKKCLILLEETDFKNAWDRCFETSKDKLRSGDIFIIKNFGKTISVCDYDSALINCEDYLQRISQLKEQAESEYKIKGKTARLFGSAFGLLSIILLL